MLIQLLLGSALIVLTFLIHASFVGIAMGLLQRMSDWILRSKNILKLVIVLTAEMLWMILSLTIAVGLWAVLYMALDIFEKFETALYFSAVSFTTLGFGDIVISRDWRLLSGLEAANGLIMFALSTAFLIELISKVRDVEGDL